MTTDSGEDVRFIWFARGRASSASDVGPTPYYIQIYDTTTGERVKTCGAGTTCALSVTAVGEHVYVAYVGSFSATYPQPNVQSSSNEYWIDWQWVK
jgi:hypothetical protein